MDQMSMPALAGAGFTSESSARRLTSQMARGLGRGYWTVKDAGGLYHYVPMPQEPFAGHRNRAILNTLAYLGATIVAAYNSLGDEIEG